MRSRALVLMVVLGLVATACGSSSSSSSPTTTSRSTSAGAAGNRGIYRLAIQRAPGIGSVLASGQGRTVYVFLPEKGGKIRCTGTCASVWPVLSHPTTAKPETTSAVHPKLVGTIANPAGGVVITYAGWPLHTYSADASHGTYRGQGSGGKWYMISPSGTVITRPVSGGIQ